MRTLASTLVVLGLVVAVVVDAGAVDAGAPAVVDAGAVDDGRPLPPPPVGLEAALRAPDLKLPEDVIASTLTYAREVEGDKAAPSTTRSARSSARRSPRARRSAIL